MHRKWQKKKKNTHTGDGQNIKL